MSEKQLNITHLYPDLLNLYGDRGNIATLCMRSAWRGIKASVTEVVGDALPDLLKTDILFLGGGSDREQGLVCQKLLNMKDELKAYAENGGVIVAVCGGYQLLGNFYQMGDETVPGLQILDIDTHRGEGRLIGNIVLECEIDGETFRLVGFENHGGRTDIKDETPLGKVLKGCGNDGKSGFEGVLKNNVFATYLHGPLLPKNPQLADIILKRALIKKYGADGAADFKPLSDGFEHEASRVMQERLL